MDCLSALLGTGRYTVRTNIPPAIQQSLRPALPSPAQPVRRRMHLDEGDAPPNHRIETRQAETIIGFISDQAPKWNSIHHWTDFFHRETPVFIGTEKIGKQVDALIYYADVKRIKRGYYHCEFKQLTDNAKAVPDFQLTDMYIHNLERMISAVPQYWLWSHKRWKRTKEEWIRRQQEEKEKK